MFNSNLHSKKQEFHNYYIDDNSIELIGLNSYTLNSINNYFNRIDNEQRDFFSQEDLLTVKNKFLGLQAIEPMTILKFNTENKKYEAEFGVQIFTTRNNEEAAAGVVDFLEKHDRVQRGELIDPRVVEVAQKIQNSYSGGILFKISLNTLGCPHDSYVKLSILDRISNHDKERTIAQKETQLVVGIPSRITNKKYSYRETANAPIGVYQNPAEGDINNPKNTIAAPLDMRYNSALGKWQGGTHQILARLLTDVDPAPLNAFTLERDTVDSVSDYYDPESSNYMSGFSTGMAMPLSVENANPHRLGPNLIGCDNKVEKILVVNRAARSFKKGDVVICSHIDNEWIIQGFDAGTISKPKAKISRWQFQKYIATSDNFMVFYKNGKYTTVNPKSLEQDIRTRYYLDLVSDAGDSSAAEPLSDESLTYLNEIYPEYLNNIAKLNLYPYPSGNGGIDTSKKGWEQTWMSQALASPFPAAQNINLYTVHPIRSTSFDQLGEHMGGLNSKNLFGRTNMTYSPDGLPNDDTFGVPYGTSMPMFWGPILTEGYSSYKIGLIKNPPTPPEPSEDDDEEGGEEGGDGKTGGGESRIKIFGNTGFFTEGTGDVFDATEDKNFLADNTNFMFSDEADGNAKQLPADVALNGSFKSKYAYPIEKDPWNLFRTNYVDGFKEYINDPQRYSYLIDSVTSGDFYGLEPLQPGLIQFSPLMLEAALHHTLFPTAGGENDIISSDYPDLKRQLSLTQRLFNTGGGGGDGDGDGGLNGPGFGAGGAASYNTFPDTVPFFPQKAQTREGLSYQDTSTEIGGDLEGPGFGLFGSLDDLDDIGSSPMNLGIKYLIPFANLVETQGATPAGGPGIFEAGDERSNVIGIIAAKNKFSGAANGTITFTTRQLFGLPERATISRGGDVSVSILGGFMAWSNSTGPGPTERRSPQWGDKQRSDGISSYGTTALRVRIMDQWPDNQTIFDGRYFTVNHVNPYVDASTRASLLASNTSLSVNSADVIQSSINNTTMYTQETSVDLRVPTDVAGTPISLDTVITSGTLMRSLSTGFINPIRRGRLVSNGGFRYCAPVVAAGDVGDTIIFSGGTGFKQGDIISCDKNIVIKVGTVGSNGEITSFVYLDHGQGFTPQDFATETIRPPIPPSVEPTKYYGFLLSLSSPNGSEAKLIIRNGKVRYRLGYDPGPEERVSSTRLSLPSNMGQGVAEGVLNTTVDLVGGNGAYDAFYFFHNDILHTTMNSTAFSPGVSQHVTLEINVG